MSNLRILLVSDAHLSRELGASKVVIELADELERLGWKCRLSSLPDLVGSGPMTDKSRADALRRYLLTHTAEFDVVDYGDGQLPFPRAEFPATTLLVARSVLLHHHFNEIRIPPDKTWRSRAHAIVYGLRDRIRHQRYIRQTNVTLAEADLINVANNDDRSVLIRDGVPEHKIVVLPYGLNRDRVPLFGELSVALPQIPTIAFVGTFDTRKGSTDFPRIVGNIVKNVPSVKFRLLGTHKSPEQVLSRFPDRLRKRIEVVSTYSSNDLPGLLASCSVGIFPSYVEGFGFGVLEMLAAGLPVVAYDAPGPPMMLPPKYLVPVGDAVSMSKKVVDLLSSTEELVAARLWAKERSQQFLWPDIARRTAETYLARWLRNQDRANASLGSSLPVATR